MDLSNTKLEAERLWILECQRMLGTDKNFKHWCRQLDLFQDETGLWRCKGKIQNAAVSYQTKHPILLLTNHHFTKLLVMEAHCWVLHNGVKETLTEIRARFWIIRGRSLVKMVIHQCRTCRRHEGMPYSAPRPPHFHSFESRRHRHSHLLVLTLPGPSMSRVKLA